MCDLKSVARQKSEAAQTKRMSALPAEVSAIHRQLAAHGLLMSGVMLKQVLATCQSALTAQGAVVTAEYRWAVAQALVASQSWVNRLSKDAASSISPLYDVALQELRRSIELASMPDLREKLTSDLSVTRSAVENDISLALRAAFEERRLGLIRGVFRPIWRVISKVFSGGST